MTVAIVNLTPYSYAAAPGRIAMPAHSLTLIVKGTFRLGHDGVATAAEEQRQPTGDELYPDDESGAGGPRYPSDFAWFKPRADVMLVGTCRAPGGHAVPMCEVAFAIGPVAKTLVVTGDRTWQRHFLRWVPSEAEPFTQMPLRYENSYGGVGFPDNPAGRGFRPVEDDSGGRSWALPNIESGSDPVVSRRDRPRPAGLGPMSAGWRQRREKLGSYDASYVKQRWPGFPEDFDWSHFNAAPEDMQVDGYLRGDESVSFENMHPIHPHYRCALPGQRVRCFVNRETGQGNDDTFEEIAMNLDTLWVDSDAEQLVLVWRGWTGVVSEDSEDIADVFVMEEPLGAPAASIDELRRRFVLARASDDGGPEPPEDSGDGPPATEQADADPTSEREAPAERPEVAALGAQIDALLARAGIDSATLSPEVRAQQARIVATLADPAASAAGREEQLEVEFEKVARSLGLNPHAIPPPSEQARAGQARLLAAFGMDGPGDDPMFARIMSLISAAIPAAGLDAADVDRIITEATASRARILGPEGQQTDDPPAPPLLTRESVRERASRGEPFVQEDLRGLDLSGLDLQGLDFSNALLVGATLAGADLQGAILIGVRASGIVAGGANFAFATLAGADLSDALLEHACLGDADLTSCNLERARLADSDLANAIFDHARLWGATLDRADATGASFAQADLTGATARGSHCEGADFSGARLDRVCFSDARLGDASMDGATGADVDCTRADISGLRASGAEFVRGQFSRCLGDGSIWQGAVLSEADFRWAHLHRAVFMSANLSGADCGAADMKFARFNKADLSGARLVDCNLFQSSLERASLVRADLSRAHLFGAELLDARIDETVFAGANLRRTKLQDLWGA